MRHGIISSTFFLAVAVLSVLAAACTGGSEGAPTETPSEVPVVSVATTLYPLEFFARRVGGERVAVANLVAPGMEAHSFEPTPADIRRLDGAKVILYSGPSFEPWMERALAATGRKDRTVIQAAAGYSDPHVWLDPLRAVGQVQLIRDGLREGDPAGAGAYDANAEALIAELSALHEAFALGLERCAQAHFVTSHAAFGHLAERYGLVQVPISGLSPDAEPGPGDLASIVETVRKLGVKHVMVEPGLSTRFAVTVAREVGALLLPLHPLESLTPEQSKGGEDYFTLMEANLESLRLALECRQ